MCISQFHVFSYSKSENYEEIWQLMHENISFLCIYGPKNTFNEKNKQKHQISAFFCFKIS